MKEIFVRLERCLGCRSCELACAVEHSATKCLFTAIGEKPVPRKRLYAEYVLEQKIPLLCRHCEDAPCVRVCRTAALSQDPLTRIVTLEGERCIGCWLCTMVCPYGVIGRELEARVIVKCDRCPDLDVPACVEACPTRALLFMEEEEFAELRRREAATLVAEGYIAAKAAA